MALDTEMQAIKNVLPLKVLENCIYSKDHSAFCASTLRNFFLFDLHTVLLLCTLPV